MSQKKAIGLSAPLWLNKNSKEFLQEKRIELLEKIAELGSISRAAKACGISYKGAWSAVNSMNNLSDKPLTINVAGGVSGGGTFLTNEGQRPYLPYLNFSAVGFFYTLSQLSTLFSTSSPTNLCPSLSIDQHHKGFILSTYTT